MILGVRRNFLEITTFPNRRILSGASKEGIGTKGVDFDVAAASVKGFPQIHTYPTSILHPAPGVSASATRA